MKKLFWLLFVLQLIPIGFLIWFYLQPSPVFLLNHMVLTIPTILICSFSIYILQIFASWTNNSIIVSKKNEEIKVLKKYFDEATDEINALTYSREKERSILQRLMDEPGKRGHSVGFFISDIKHFNEIYSVYIGSIENLHKNVSDMNKRIQADFDHLQDKNRQLSKLGDELITIQLKLDECSQKKNSKRLPKKPRKTK